MLQYIYGQPQPAHINLLYTVG